MSKCAAWALISLFAVMQNSFSQENQPPATGVINGKVYDADRQKPLEFANVILFSAKDSAMVTGTASGENGGFQIGNLQPGAYYLDIHFIGYKKRFESLESGPAKLAIDLGKILLQQTALSLEGVEVQGEAMAMTYHLDKKVINVGQQATAISGAVVEVLENVPAVTVDIEGNVSLRGSSNFTVLIDGRPSVLEPSEALQQIPASAVENIEIITNPSAKHDPEGAAGIINIVMKKDKREGRSGIANLNAGMGDKYGGDFLYEHKEESCLATFGVDYNRRIFTGDDREENRTTRDGLMSFIRSQGDSRRQDISLGARRAWLESQPPRGVELQRTLWQSRLAKRHGVELRRMVCARNGKPVLFQRNGAGAKAGFLRAHHGLSTSFCAEGARAICRDLFPSPPWRRDDDPRPAVKQRRDDQRPTHDRGRPRR